MSVIKESSFLFFAFYSRATYVKNKVTIKMGYIHMHIQTHAHMHTCTHAQCTYNILEPLGFHVAISQWKDFYKSIP